MKALCWLDENDIIIISWVTDKIQQMAMRKNCEITANAARGEEEKWIVTLGYWRWKYTWNNQFKDLEG